MGPTRWFSLRSQFGLPSPARLSLFLTLYQCPERRRSRGRRKRGNSSSPSSRRCSGTQTDQRGDCSGSSACPAAGLAGQARPYPLPDRAVWRFCALHAARGGSGPWFASDNAAENSGGKRPCQSQETTRGIVGYTAGTASKARSKVGWGIVYGGVFCENFCTLRTMVGRSGISAGNRCR